jgi:hypothetical protein
VLYLEMINTQDLILLEEDRGHFTTYYLLVVLSLIGNQLSIKVNLRYYE